MLYVVSMAGRRGVETMNNNNNKKLIVYSKVLPYPSRIPLRFVCFITPLGDGGGSRGGSATGYSIILFSCVYYTIIL